MYGYKDFDRLLSIDDSMTLLYSNFMKWSED